MLPFAEACGGLERAARDIASATGKEVDLLIHGEDVQVDRSVLEGLKDPLLHLVRNAVDHGLETPRERQAAGKGRRGTVTVGAALKGTQVEVVVFDDGGGLDLERIRESLRSRGVAVPQDEHELMWMIFQPTFSTAKIISDVSGRGVGLDVVQSQIESLHGSVNVSYLEGHGTTFSLRVPLTLTTIRSVLVKAAGQLFAIPTTSTQQLVRFEAADVCTVAGRDVLKLGGSPVPLIPLSNALGLKQKNQPVSGAKQVAIVVGAGTQQAAFVVDQLIAEQEVTVKGLGARINRLRHLSGATLMPSGKNCVGVKFG